MVDVWLIFNLIIPFVEVRLKTKLLEKDFHISGSSSDTYRVPAGENRGQSDYQPSWEETRG